MNTHPRLKMITLLGLVLSLSCGIAAAQQSPAKPSEAKRAGGGGTIGSGGPPNEDGKPAASNDGGVIVLPSARLRVNGVPGAVGAKTFNLMACKEGSNGGIERGSCNAYPQDANLDTDVLLPPGAYLVSYGYWSFHAEPIVLRANESRVLNLRALSAPGLNGAAKIKVFPDLTTDRRMRSATAQRYYGTFDNTLRSCCDDTSGSKLDSGTTRLCSVYNKKDFNLYLDELLAQDSNGDLVIPAIETGSLANGWKCKIDKPLFQRRLGIIEENGYNPRYDWREGSDFHQATMITGQTIMVFPGTYRITYQFENGPENTVSGIRVD